jgi:hypothetical protein
MNKKVLGLVFAFIFLAMLAAPMIGAVMAGKGQEKLDFLLHMEGVYAPPAEKAWVTDSGTQHVQGLPWIIVGDFYIEVGEGGAVEAIPKECLSYFGLMDLMANQKQGFAVLRVRETITIYTDETKVTERGTIEILTQGVNPGGNGLIVNGHGTGEFEGVKITGLTTTTPSGTGFLIVDRAGTVMGWPT